MNLINRPINPTVKLDAIAQGCQMPGHCNYMTKAQMAEAAKDILEAYGDLLHAEFLKRLEEAES